MQTVTLRISNQTRYEIEPMTVLIEFNNAEYDFSGLKVFVGDVELLLRDVVPVAEMSVWESNVILPNGVYPITFVNTNTNWNVVSGTPNPTYTVLVLLLEAYYSWETSGPYQMFFTNWDIHPAITIFYNGVVYLGPSFDGLILDTTNNNSTLPTVYIELITSSRPVDFTWDYLSAPLISDNGSSYSAVISKPDYMSVSALLLDGQAFQFSGGTIPYETLNGVTEVSWVNENGVISRPVNTEDIRVDVTLSFGATYRDSKTYFTVHSSNPDFPTSLVEFELNGVTSVNHVLALQLPPGTHEAVVVITPSPAWNIFVDDPYVTINVPREKARSAPDISLVASLGILLVIALAIL